MVDFLSNPRLADYDLSSLKVLGGGGAAMPEALARMQDWYRRYGRWSLLLSWAPIIGDPLTVAAGVLREPLPTFILFVAIAKTARYLALAAAALHWM